MPVISEKGHLPKLDLLGQLSSALVDCDGPSVLSGVGAEGSLSILMTWFSFTTASITCLESFMAGLYFL